MKLALTNYEHELFIGATNISGVSDTRFSYTVPERPINILGFGHVGEGFYEADVKHPYSLSVLDGAVEGNLDVNGFLISEDFFLKYTGDISTSGSLRFGDDPPKYLGFSEVYLTKHSVQCSINQLPTYNSSFMVFGSGGEGLNYEGRKVFPDVNVVNQGGINLNFAGSGTNRVTSFSYGVTVNRAPIYPIGSEKPTQVDIVWPIQVDATVELETDDYSIRRMSETFIQPNVEFFEITLKDCNNNYIQRYPMTGARLIDYSAGIGSNDVQQVKLRYISYINKR